MIYTLLYKFTIIVIFAKKFYVFNDSTNGPLAFNKN